MKHESAPHLSLRTPINRKTFLRGTGAAIALPLLGAMAPSVFAKPSSPAAKRRMIFINLHLGFMARNFVPAQNGPGYRPTKYLKVIDKYREDYTVITGTSHPGVNGAHSADVSFLTGAPDAASASFRNSVSIDQIAADQIGNDTRYAYLPLGLDHRSMSFSRGGASIPAISRPSLLFAKLFIDGSPAEKARINRQLEDGRSIMDFVSDSAKNMSETLGARDREKLDEYLTNVRETERRLQKSREWQDIRKPKRPGKPPKEIQDRSDFISKIALMYDMMHLAIQSDSTRIITYNQPNLNDVLPLNGISQGYHSLSHHNGDPEKIRQLELVELEQMKKVSALLEKLTTTKEENETLLDRSMVMVGSIFGNANKHDTSNMPILLAGGGFKHGQHLAFPRNNNTPTSNLFLSMLHRAGVNDISSFSSSTGALKGLEQI